MKLLLWIAIGAATFGISFWLINTSTDISNPSVFPLVFIIFAVPPIGAFWMLYTSIRHERQPFPLVLPAFVPFSFCWYYFERVRPSRNQTRILN